MRLFFLFINLYNYEIIYLQLEIMLKNSKRKIVLKQKLFIGNWNKSTNTKNNYENTSTNYQPYGK